MVARDEVLKQLLDSSGGPVVIEAPGGYGKTTTVLLWDEADPRPFVWVNLDVIDDDPVHLVRHIAIAVAQLRPDAAADPRTVRVMTRPTDAVELDLLPDLLATIEDMPPHVLVLDDVHNLVSPEARRCLDALVVANPTGSQVALLGRSVPANLARLRLRGDMCELSAVDLAMSVSEAGVFFDRSGAGLDQGTVEDLVDRTEGWACGLRLAALAIDRDGYRSARPLGGRDRLLVDYLVEEVLGAQTPETVEFLEQSAVLDRMCGPLLDEFLDTEDSTQRLAEIAESGNVFLVSLDRERHWYRYHHLFGELLRARLAVSDPQLARELEGRASRLLENSGDLDGAIRHAVAGGDISRASDLIFSQALQLVNGGRTALLGRWLDMIGPESAQQSPAAAMASGWYALMSGDLAGLKSAISTAERSGYDGPLADGSPSLEVALATLRACAGWEGVQGVLHETSIVRSKGPNGSPWYGVATLLAGTAHSMLGEFSSARERIWEAMEGSGGAPVQAATSRAHGALVAIYQDDLVEAERLTSEAIDLMEEHDLGGVLTTVPVYPIASLVWARSGRTEEARRAASIGLQAVSRIEHISPRTSLLIYVLLARTALALGDRNQAQVCAEEAIRARRRESSATYVNHQLDEVLGQLAGGGGDQPAQVPAMTVAQLRVLTYMPTHLSLKEIAETLFISRNTAKTHSVAIYRKLGVSSRREAVEAARRFGILTS